MSSPCRMVVLAPVAFGPAPGGVEAVGRFLSRHWFDAQGNLPLTLSANEEAPATDETVSFGFGGRRLALVAWCALRARRRIGRVRGVLCLHAGLAPAARVLARSLHCRYVVFLHGLEVWRAARWRERWGGARAAGVIANSRYTLRRAAAAQSWIAARPAEVCPLGLFAPVEPPVASQPRDRLVLAVGRVRPGEWHEDRAGRRIFGKGFELLLDAFGSVASRDSGVRLVIAGGGAAAGELEAEISRRGLTASVRLERDLGDAGLDALYRRARVFCLPSGQEGFGLVYVEAMARGVPCACIDSGAAAEVVTHGATGLVAPAGDATTLAAHLRELLDDDDGWRRMSAAALQDAAGKFSAAAVRRRLDAAMDVLLGRAAA